MAWGMLEHEPVGQDTRAIGRVAVKAERAWWDRADSEAAAWVDDGCGRGAICGACLHSARAGRHELSQKGVVGHLYLKSEFSGCKRQVAQTRWLRAHASQFRLRTLEGRVMGEGGEFGVGAAPRESRRAHRDEFRGHAALGSERLTERSEKLTSAIQR